MLRSIRDGAPFSTRLRRGIAYAAQHAKPSLVLDQAPRLIARKPLRAPQANQLDQEHAPGNLGPTSLDQPAAGFDGAAGGQQIVDQEHVLARCDAVAVHLEAVGAVLELVVK